MVTALGSQRALPPCFLVLVYPPPTLSPFSMGFTLANGTSVNMRQIRLERYLHIGTGPSKMLLPCEEVRASPLKTHSPAKGQHPKPNQENEAILEHAAPVKPQGNCSSMRLSAAAAWDSRLNQAQMSDSPSHEQNGCVRSLFLACWLHGNGNGHTF